LCSIIPNSVVLQALESNHSVVTYEVMLSIQRLVNKFGAELQDPAWDLVLSIIEAVINYIGLFFIAVMSTLRAQNAYFFSIILYLILN
jgi:hypothetical protein